MINIYNNFNYNIEKAKCLLDLFELKKFREEVLSGSIENSVDDFRMRLKNKFPILGYSFKFLSRGSSNRSIFIPPVIKFHDLE